MSINFPQDISIYEDFIQCGSEKVAYDDIKSIRVSVRESTTNLTAHTGIPTWKNLSSQIGIELINDNVRNRIVINVTAYEEWGPFKNKKGMDALKDGLAFSRFLEEKTFEQRMQHYLKTGNSEMHFKYRGYEFLKNKKIRFNGKIYASFDSNEYSVKQGFRRLTFEKKGALNVLVDFLTKDTTNETAINLAHDEDVIMHLINKLI